MAILKNNNDKFSEQHPYHLVDPSPWPFLTSVSLLALVLGFILYFHNHWVCPYVIVVKLSELAFILSRWFSDIICESTFEGHHTKRVQRGIKMGMALFIVSEVMFFFSFFWAFFYFALCPSIAIGYIWPPLGIVPLDPYSLPLLNTIILLSSGVTITCSHRAIVVGSRSITTKGIVYTLMLSIFFTCIQWYEYNTASFSINDTVYGSLFYICTGFHGIHVFVGTVFLSVCLWRHINYHFTRKQHVGFECAIWYWHFVDVVWLFLFMTVYIWGSF